MKWHLYADLGNATLHWGISAGDEWLVTDRVHTGPEMTEECVESLQDMMQNASAAPEDYAGGLMCSSAPATTAVVTDALKTHHAMEIPEMSGAHRDAVPTEYHDPSQIGPDRIANAAAARLYGDPCVILDIGTCITAEVVSGGVLLGGAIAPGMPVMTAGLIERTAHLADFLEELASPSTLTSPARSTEENLALGLYTAMVGTTDALAKNMSAELQDPQIVMTGGWAEWVRKHSTVAAQTDSILTLRGLQILDELV